MSLETMGGREDQAHPETLIKSLPHVFFAAVEQSSEAVVITDARGIIEYVNPAFTRITGYTREETLGQNPRLLKSGEHDPELYRELWKTILTGESWRGELINRRKDGSFYAEEMHITPVCGPRGEVTHFIATQQDATTRRQLEQQLKWVQTVEAVGRLAGGVVHEMNNLLAIISGYGQLLQGRVNPEGLGAVAEILKAAERAAALTRQLLSFSRGQILAPEVLDLNLLVSDALKMLRLLVGDGIELATIQQADLGHVMADRGQIEQAIMHLAVNARDAMTEGGKITIETANVYLDEAYSRAHVGASPGPHVMVSVAAMGAKPDAESPASSFEPLFTTKRAGNGAGLGLANVFGVIKQSGGHIWIQPMPGQGTAFKIYLPRVEKTAPKMEPVQPRPVLPAGSEAILLVVEEHGVRSIVGTTLEALGYKVLEAHGPVQALAIMEQSSQPIHLLLTDLVMPQTGAKELASSLQASRPGSKVLYMPGQKGDTSVRHSTLDAGPSYLLKPFTPETLARKVREVLDLPKQPQ
jgi:two-component system, cell cycle sensor histidine kinase and response regulator CckA